MWCFKASFRATTLMLTLMAGGSFLSACSVEPLNASRPISGSAETGTVKTILAATEVAPATTRDAQQVRNALLFDMNGGELLPGGQYKVALNVSTNTSLVSTQIITQAPTAGQTQIKVGFTLLDKNSGAIVGSGTRSALASYDRTPQSFANQRAERDAVNRAAKDVARQIRLALGQIIAGL